MGHTPAGRTGGYSRRAVLGQFGLAGAAAALFPLGGVRHAFAQFDDRPWYFLSDDEARWLAAACDVLIPEDEFPSASQAGVVDYIDFQLAVDYGTGNGLYMKGPYMPGSEEQGYQFGFPPSDLFRRAIAALIQRGWAFADMDEGGRESAMRDLSESQGMLTEDIPAKAFFDELLDLCNQGYFADPMYLGNRNYAGWRMVGFPGAHAYYQHSVDDHNLPYPAPPKGITHNPGGYAIPPRVIPKGGNG